MSAALATSSTAPAGNKVNARVPHQFDLAQVFPEVPGLFGSAGQFFTGFKDSGSGVPPLMKSFIQEASFLEEFLYFVFSDHLRMITLTGPTGCGKTERVLNFYSRLNIPVLHVSATGDTKIWDLVGEKEIRGGNTEFNAKSLYKAMKYGYPFLIDEVYRLPARITSKFHTIRDSGTLYIDDTGETLKAAKGFKFIMTANQAGLGDSTGFYSGDEVQDAAFLNGSPTIECTYPAPEIEEQIVRAALVKAHPAFATEPSLGQFPTQMVAVANRCRAVFVGTGDGTSDRIELPFSTRHLVWWADAFVKFRGSNSGTHPLYKSLDFVMTRRGCPTTRVAIDGFLLAEFGINRSDVL